MSRAKKSKDERSRNRIKPILFNTPMVKAILRGDKTQTRRIVKPPIEGDLDTKFKLIRANSKREYEITNGNGETWLRKPKYAVRDELWVRETFFDCSAFKQADVFREVEGNYLYRADDTFIGCHRWKPSIFMPREAARIHLIVTKVRLERLQDMTDEDAIQEGILSQQPADQGDKTSYFLYPSGKAKDDKWVDDPITSFCSLWESIHGRSSWEENPLVLVYEFQEYDPLLPF